MFGPTKDRFAKLMTDAITASGTTKVRQYDKKGFALEIEQNGQAKTFNLANAYTEYCNTKSDDQPEVINRHCGAVIEVLLPDSLAEASLRFLPLLQSRQFFEEINFGKAREHPLFVPFNLLTEDVALCVIFDTPIKVIYINQERLEGWQIDFTHAYNRAAQKLSDRTKPSFEDPGTGLYVGNWGDFHGAARLMFTDMFTDLRVDGRVIAVALDATTIAITGEYDINNILVISQAIEEQSGRGMTIPMAPIILDRGRWQLFVPPEDSMIFPFVQYLNLRVLLRAYARSQRLLLNRNIAANEFCVLEELDSGALTSATTWAHGSTPLLPRSEHIIFEFTDPEGTVQRRAASWQAAEAVIGDLFEPTVIYPQYLRPKRFPSSAELNVIFQKDPENEHFIDDFSFHPLDDEPRLRTIAIQLRIRPCPGAVPLGEMQCTEYAALQAFSCPLAFDEVAAFYKSSLKNIHKEERRDNDKQDLFISKAAITSDIYIYVSRGATADTTTILIESQALPEHLIDQRVLDLMANKPIKLTGPKLMT